jgi:2-amino-4-hydroxy-6-hydroxymethyldihydropteridine diphosphokinase
MDYRPATRTVFDAGCIGTIVCSRADPGGVNARGYNNMRTAVALGSNLGDRLETLREAREQIVNLPGVQRPFLSSALYETEPIGCEPGAPKFLNAVVEFGYQGDLESLLHEAVQIEQSLGRERQHPKNVSRMIDIDLLYCGDRQIENERLHLPHPRMHTRRFVLQPLADIRPDLVLPGQKKPVRELLAQLEESADVVQLIDDW